MQAQINFSNSSSFANFMTGLSSLEGAQAIIHGIFIYPHPIWRRIAENAAQGGVFDPPWFSWWSHGWADGLLDMSQSFPEWDHYCGHARKQNDPFLVRIYIEPTTNRTLDRRRQIQSYAAQQKFFVAVEEEEQGWLSASIDGGVEVNAPSSGSSAVFSGISMARSMEQPVHTLQWLLEHIFRSPTLQV